VIVLLGDKQEPKWGDFDKRLIISDFMQYFVLILLLIQLILLLI